MAKEEKIKKETKNSKKESKENSQKSREAELIDDIKHLQAEFENYKKRVDRDKEDFKAFAKKGIILDIIPIIDNLELALNNKNNVKEFIKGIELIFAQLNSKLEEEGVESIKVKEGDKFNPYEHEALLAEEVEQEKNTITRVIQKGYKMNGIVVRHAKVAVAK